MLLNLIKKEKKNTEHTKGQPQMPAHEINSAMPFLFSDQRLLSNASSDKEHCQTWTTICQHSIAKLSKSYAESCFAPNPLPEEVKQKLNEQIESSRDLLLKILFESPQRDKVI